VSEYDKQADPLWERIVINGYSAQSGVNYVNLNYNAR
jgi:hypothetical protein